MLAFDLWGPYAHYKQIYATTTALTYPIPTKTAIYGTLGALLGLEKRANHYLRRFAPGECRIGIQVGAPLVSTRINMNLRPVFGALKATENRKPTTMEFMRSPRYRIFVQHSDDRLMDELSQRLVQGNSVYTPTLGLANLIASTAWVGEWQVDAQTSEEAVLVHSCIPRAQLIKLDPASAFRGNNRIIELSMYPLEMDEQRNVTNRDDILLDQHGHPIAAKVRSHYAISLDHERQNICTF